VALGLFVTRFVAVEVFTLHNQIHSVFVFRLHFDDERGLVFFAFIRTFYKQQTLLFTHENLTATLRSGNLLWLVVYDASAILDCKYTTFSVNKEY